LDNENQIKSPTANAENQSTQTGQTGASVYAFRSMPDQSTQIQLLHGKGFGKPGGQPGFPKLGEIRDLDNTVWDVREIRPTKHGFDMLYGTRTLGRGVLSGGKPRLIATIDLMEFWSVNGTRRDGILFDLPEGHRALDSMRAQLGFNFLEATHAFWNDRIDDLRSLPAKEFAARHGVSQSAAMSRRYRLFGSTKRPRGWWRNRKVLSLLLSSQTLRKVASKLGISNCHVFHLRARAKQELLEENNRVNPKLVSFRTFSETAKTGDCEPPLAA
jgi:hypothetical protein